MDRENTSRRNRSMGVIVKCSPFFRFLFVFFVTLFIRSFSETSIRLVPGDMVESEVTHNESFPELDREVDGGVSVYRPMFPV